MGARIADEVTAVFGSWGFIVTRSVQNRTAERDRVKAEHDVDVNVLALRSLAEILGDGHDPDRRRDLRRRIDDLLGADPHRPTTHRPDDPPPAREETGPGESAG